MCLKPLFLHFVCYKVWVYFTSKHLLSRIIWKTKEMKYIFYLTKLCFEKNVILSTFLRWKDSALLALKHKYLLDNWSTFNQLCLILAWNKPSFFEVRQVVENKKMTSISPSGSACWKVTILPIFGDKNVVLSATA